MDRKDAGQVIRIPRRDAPMHDEPQVTAHAIIDKYCEEFKRIIGGLEYGSAAIEATVHAGRVVKMDVARRIKLDVTV